MERVLSCSRASIPDGTFARNCYELPIPSKGTASVGTEYGGVSGESKVGRCAKPKFSTQTQARGEDGYFAFLPLNEKAPTWQQIPQTNS